MKLNPVTDTFVENLRGVLPAGTFVSAEPRYFEDPRGNFSGNTGAVFAPASAQEVSVIVRAASDGNIGVVPYGGGTGLVCGQISPDGPAPIVVSLERMTAIRAIYPTENTLIAEAGAILHDVHAAAADADLLFPLWLASEGSCRIGGNLATNAGGVNVIRYGNARDLCLGLEAVLPDGQIWNGLKRLRKDNTGYDLKNLLIGAEGTLGIITAAALRLYPKPENEGAALFVVPGPAAAVSLLSLAQRRLGDVISAFELISGTGMAFISETMPAVRQPFVSTPDWCVLVDLGTTAGAMPEDLLADLFEEALTAGIATDGLVAQNQGQRSDFWKIREFIPAANKKIGAILSNDISIPIGAIPDFIDKGASAINSVGDFRINCFGHLGDGNLHYNVFPPVGRAKADFPTAGDQLRRIVHDLVAEFDGSFSAEHGVGRLKVDELQRYGDPAKLAAMRAIKTALDPKGIMNPGAVLPVN